MSNFSWDDHPIAGEFDWDKHPIHQQPKSISPLESALKGAEQGGTLGFSDELGGGFQALLDKLGVGGGVSAVDKSLADQGFKGDLTPTSGDVYTKARDEDRKIIKDSQAANPMSTLAGNLGGGLVTGAVAAPAAGVGKIQQLLQAAKLGAGAGAISGLGTSDADLTKGDVTGALKDTALGGAIGGVTGPAIVGAGMAGGKALDLAKNSNIGRDVIRGFEKGLEGSSIIGRKAAGEATENVTKEAQHFQDTVTKALGKYSDLKQDILEGLGKEGKTVNFDDIIGKGLQQIEDSLNSGKIKEEEAKQLKKFLTSKLYSEMPEEVKGAFQLKTIEKFKIDPETGEHVKVKDIQTLKGKGVNPDELEANIPAQLEPIGAQVTTSGDSIIKTTKQGLDQIKAGVLRGEIEPSKAAELVKQIQSEAYDITRGNPNAESILKNVAREASDAVESLNPDKLKPLNEKLSALMETQNKDLGAPEYRRALGEKQVSDDAINLIKHVDNEFEPETARKYKNLIDTFKKVNPGLGKRLEERGATASQDFNLGKKANASGKGVLNQVIGLGTDLSAKASNVAGQVVSTVGKPMVNLAALGDVELGSLSNAVRSSTIPGAERIAGMIEKVSQTPTDKRSALLFALSQNKDYRKFMEDFAAK